MKIEVKVPQLSESVSEATLLTWHKQVGEAVSEGQNLIDIETDKVVLELPAIKSGVLSQILKQNGDKVGSGEVIAMLDTDAAPTAAATKTSSAQAVAGSAAAVMPAAQKLAAEKGVDTANISGTGRGGRVTKEDVLNAGDKAPPVAGIPKPELGGVSNSACR